MDKKYIYQIKNREWIENELGSEIMIPIFGNRKKDKFDIYLQSYLLPTEAVEKEMEEDSVNMHASNMSPGITVYGGWENNEKEYYRWGNDYGYEPLVILRDYNGLASETVEVVEEFRLLFNLYHNVGRGEYMDVSDGESTVVVKEDDNGFITVHKRYLKSYLAVKEKAMVIHVDSRCDEIDNTPKLERESLSYHNADNTVLYTLTIGNMRPNNYSVIYGKRIIFGGSLSESNIWPYNEEKKYTEFIIGVDECGKEVKYTCDPKQLSDFFGTNPTAPHYLTPVYFDAEVLGKYYAKPDIYKVEDGCIRCGSLWLLYYDNNAGEGYVSAYLGDLGKSLPNEREQFYWRSYNKAIGGKLSQAKIKRDFMSVAADSTAADFVFKRTYMEMNKKFEQKFGWPLFLALTEQDKYNFETLRIPINNSVSEMDMLVLALVKVLLDSLNEKKIVKQLTGTCEKLVGSISKIEAWFGEKALEDYDVQIKYLRNLQELRSSGTGHRKGKGYDKICAVLGVQKDNYPETFAKLLELATQFLKYVDENMEALL